MEATGRGFSSHTYAPGEDKRFLLPVTPRWRGTVHFKYHIRVTDSLYNTEAGCRFSLGAVHTRDCELHSQKAPRPLSGSGPSLG